MLNAYAYGFPYTDQVSAKVLQSKALYCWNQQTLYFLVNYSPV